MTSRFGKEMPLRRGDFWRICVEIGVVFGSRAENLRSSPTGGISCASILCCQKTLQVLLTKYAWGDPRIVARGVRKCEDCLWEAWGIHFSSVSISATFVCPAVPQINAMHCVALDKIGPSYMLHVQPFVALFQHESNPSWPLPFHLTGFCRKGW